MAEEMLIAQGMCPICGSEMVSYESMELGDGDCVYYPVTCDKCGATWKEVYDLTFTGNEDIEEGTNSP